MFNTGQKATVPKTFCHECGSLHQRYLTVPQVAKALNLTVDAIWGMKKRRQIPFVKLGGRVLFRYSDIEASMVYYPSIAELTLD